MCGILGIHTTREHQLGPILIEAGKRLAFRGYDSVRWATFGAPSQANAQPHLDSDGVMVEAHNGNVVNNVELREALLAEGMTVRSTNDGESCVHAVERYVRQGHNMISAIRHAYNDLEGDCVFVFGAATDDKLYALNSGAIVHRFPGDLG